MNGTQPKRLRTPIVVPAEQLTSPMLKAENVTGPVRTAVKPLYETSHVGEGCGNVACRRHGCMCDCRPLER